MFPGDPGPRLPGGRATRSRRTCWSPRTCSATPTSRETTSCSRAARSRSATTSSSTPPAHARQIQQAIETTACRGSRRCSMRRSRSSRTSTSTRRLRRERYPEYRRRQQAAASTTSSESASPRSIRPPPAPGSKSKKRAPVPPHPERDLLWFIAHYAPELESWERDIFLAVREESFYFYPVFACQIMNEGWASYWHARLLREANFLPQQAYLDAIKSHSDVVRPVAADQQVALAINPYHLGFSMWEHIVESDGLERARHHAAGRRFRLHPQPPDARAGGRARPVPLQRAQRRTGESARERPGRAARGDVAPEIQFRRADRSRRRTSATTARWS